MAEPREFTHMLKDAVVRRRVLEWYEDASIHQPSHAEAVCHSSQPLRLAITTATV